MIAISFAILFFFFVVTKRKIRFTDIFPFIFFGFIILYSGTCFIATYFDFQRIKSVSLLKKDIINSYLQVSALALFTFCLCLLFDKYKYSSSGNSVYIGKNLVVYYLIYVLVYPVAFYLAIISNWTSGERVGLIPSLAAYFRNIITVITVFFFACNNIKKKWKFLFLFLYLLLTIKSTQRTNFFIVAIAFIYTIGNPKKAFLGGILSIFLLLAIGSFRNGVSIFNIFYPLFGEGIFGSWGSLNAINEIKEYGWTFENISYGINGCLNFFLKFLSLRLPEVSDCLTRRGINYYPMGGFFFLSDAVLWQPFAGPVFFTLVIYLVYRKSYKTYSKKKTPGSLLALGLLFELVKASSTTATAMFVFHFLFLYLLKKLNAMLVISCGHKYMAGEWRHL